MKNILLAGILVIIFSVGGMILLWKVPTAESPAAASGGSNVAMVNGTQVINISAKGGYAPRTTAAKADTPTQIKVTTNGTYDCSSGLRIPLLAYEVNLPPSGDTLVTVPPQKAGTVLTGVCIMGMYNFSVAFN